ncbi:MAG: DUF835 domain-containing protein [Promethearchaeota archaeon]
MLQFKEINPEIVCTIITGYGTVQTAINALKEGAEGYFLKPLFIDEVIYKIHEALEKRALQRKLKEQNLKLFEQAIHLQQENNNLKQEFNIKPKKEMKQSSPTEIKYQVHPGIIYLFQGDSAIKPLKHFYDLVTHGYSGLIIARLHPNKIKKIIALRDTPIVWINNTKYKDENLYIRPDLETVLYLIRKFLKEPVKNGNNNNLQDLNENQNNLKVVLLEGLEYLLTYNGYSQTIRFFEKLCDAVYLSQGVLLTIFNPEAVSKKELIYFQRYTQPLDYADRSRSLSLSQL